MVMYQTVFITSNHHQYSSPVLITISSDGLREGTA
jgi:hypothetical protein